jgi:CRISPR-associated endonuclease/helicase Cas3
MTLGPLHVAWAKTTVGDNDSPLFHLLRNHLLDTAAVAQVFWREVTSAAQKRFLAASTGLDELAAGRLLTFLAGGHDVGKLTPTFQNKCRKSNRYERLVAAGLPHRPEALYFKGYHGTQSARILDRYLNDEPGWSPAHAAALASIIGGHHGNFVKREEFQDFPLVELGGRPWIDVQFELLREIAVVADVLHLPPPTALPTDACIFIAGFVSVCDWIASNADFFPYADLLSPTFEYFNERCERAKNCLSQLRWMPRAASAPVNNYQELFDLEHPSPLQTELLRLAHDPAGPRLFIVEAPMGDGKTEAGCAAAEQLRHDLGCSGVYFALPTQATSEQMFARIMAMLERRWQGGQPEVLALLHGQASLSREYEELRRRGREYFAITAVGGVDDSPRVVAGDWFAQSKRGLLSPYGVGTVDQGLKAVLGSLHFFVRLFGIAGKVLIVDEVHAYDTYMSTLLDRLLEWAASLATPVVLLSATLPESRRKELTTAYRKGLGRPAEETASAAYPRITVVAETATQVLHTEARLPSRTVSLRHVESADLVSDLQVALQHGGNIAVICNTVKKARELYQSVRDLYPGEVHLLHARYLAKHRRERVEAALGRVSKNVQRPHRSVLISTQIIEQSLDLDFDLLVTEPAPIDLLLQRMGRLFRHPRPPHPGFSSPACWIVNPLMKDGAPIFGDSARVYDSHILLCSWLSIRQRTSIVIPTEIDELIGSVYEHPVPPTDEGPLLTAWSKSRAQMERKRDVETAAAKEAYIAPPRTGQIESLVRNVEDAEMVFTRLIRPTISLIVVYRLDEEWLGLDPKGDVRIDEKTRPSLEQLRQLLENAVTHPVREVSDIPDQPTIPPAWKNRSALSGMHIIILDQDGQGTIGGLTFRLDAELGLYRIYKREA